MGGRICGVLSICICNNPKPREIDNETQYTAKQAPSPTQLNANVDAHMVNAKRCTTYSNRADITPSCFCLQRDCILSQAFLGAGTKLMHKSNCCHCTKLLCAYYETMTVAGMLQMYTTITVLLACKPKQATHCLTTALWGHHSRQSWGMGRLSHHMRVHALLSHHRVGRHSHAHAIHLHHAMKGEKSDKSQMVCEQM